MAGSGAMTSNGNAGVRPPPAVVMVTAHMAASLPTTVKNWTSPGPT